MSASFGVSADSLYAQTKARLQRRHYRFDETDDRGRRMVVRAPKDKTKVEITIVSKGDSSTVSVLPIGATDLVSSLSSALTVTYDATMDSAAARPAAPAP
jgi:hypothetical protein